MPNAFGVDIAAGRSGVAGGSQADRSEDRRVPRVPTGYGPIRDTLDGRLMSSAHGRMLIDKASTTAKGGAS